MRKNSPLFLTIGFLAILTVSRIPLKLFFIDNATGFYSRENILGIAYNIAFFAFIIIGAYAIIKSHEDYSTTLRLGGVRCILSFISGTLIFISAFLGLKESLLIDFTLPNSVPKVLVFPSYVLGIISGALILLLALWVFSGSSKGVYLKSAALLLPIWCSINSLREFLNFRFTVYASDEMISSIFMISSTLFFLYLSKTILFPSEEKKYVIPAFVTVISGLPLAIGQVVAGSLLEVGLFGPSHVQCLNIVGVSIFALCFLAAPSRRLKNIS